MLFAEFQHMFFAKDIFMKMQIALLLSMAYCGSLISSDQRVAVVTLYPIHDNNKQTMLNQEQIDQFGQKTALITGSATLLAGALPRNSYVVMDTETGKFKELDKTKFWAFNEAKKVWEVARQQVVNRKNWIESGSELVSNFSKNNPVLQMLSLTGCARSFACLVWALGTPALTQKYLCWQLFIALSSSALTKFSYTANNASCNESIVISCLFGAFCGVCARS